MPVNHPQGGDVVPVEERNHCRTVIDAETRHQIFFDNLPVLPGLDDNKSK
jgi:hypothetical protein